ncbi:MAG: hypothetical protein ACRD0A_11890 [Acidimicrobiales bacterium]
MSRPRTRSRPRQIVLAPRSAWVAAGAAMAVAVALYAAAIVLAHDAIAFGTGELIRGETPGFFTVMVGGAGLVALSVALLVGARGGVGPAVALLLAGWAVALVGAGPVLRADFVLAGAGHLVVAELAYWSIERRIPPGPDQGWALATRAAELVAMLALVAVIGWWLAGAVAGRAGGASLDLIGVLVVLGFGAVVVWVVRRA